MKQKYFKVECGCYKCQNMCINPCVFAPKEAKRALEAGLIGKITCSYYDFDNGHSDWVKILLPHTRRYRCVFLNENRKCMLHNTDLKPLEGRVATCKGEQNDLRKRMAKMWDTPLGKRVVKLYEDLWDKHNALPTEEQLAHLDKVMGKLCSEHYETDIQLVLK